MPCMAPSAKVTSSEFATFNKICYKPLSLTTVCNQYLFTAFNVCVREVCEGEKQGAASKRSIVGHVANQASRLHCESGVPTSTLSKTEGGSDEEA